MNDADISRMLADLRDFSADLLNTSAHASSIKVVFGSNRGASEALQCEAQRILALARPAWDEISRREVVSDRDLVGAAIPGGFDCEILPLDWQRANGRLLPRRWHVPALEHTPDLPCLRWLLYAVGVAGTLFKERQERLNTWVDDARRARVAGTSDWAAQAKEDLDELLAQNAGAIASAKRLSVALLSRANTRVSPSRRLPDPFPRSATWVAIRRHVANIINPREVLPAIAADGLATPIPICDLPILYQRWAGLQIIRSLQRQEWVISGDPVGALWLGGRIHARRNGVIVHLDIETRYAARETGPLTAELESQFRDGLTPDFVFVFDGALGRSAWVLDATLATDPDLLSEKRQKYISGLRMVAPTMIAGTPIFPPPGRVWIIGPAGHGRVRLEDPQGNTGYVGMAPDANVFSGLDAWLQDLGAVALPPKATTGRLASSLAVPT